MFKRLVWLVILLLPLSGICFAQFEAGSLAGTVKDLSGAIVPGAKIEVRNRLTNSVRTGTSSEGGQFDFVALEPGQYSITATHPGFRDQTEVFQLTVGQRQEIDLVLRLPSESTTVTVTSESTETVETASSELGNVEDSHQVAALPLNSRNFTQLVGLSPGVNMRGNSNNSQANGYTTGRGSSGAIVNGNPGEATVYLFDGIQSINNDINVVILFPPIDGIEEFKVQTSGAPAAYGGAPSMINLTYHSGTNAYHGAFYEFVRNSDLDAKNYFDSHSTPITPFHMNQFGATVGGPVIIPHLLNGRNKLFFFGDWEGRRMDQAQTYTSTVPTAAFLQGNFAALCTAGFRSGLCANTAQQLTNPLNGSPFLNNYVSPTLWNPSSAALATLFPAANIPGSGLVNNYLYPGRLQDNVNQGDVRIDYKTDKTSIFGRFSKEDPITVSPGYLPAPAIGGGPSRPGTTYLPGEQLVVGYGRSIGSNMYYEVRAAGSRLSENIVIANDNLANISTQYGIPNANVPGDPGLTNISIAGQVGLGDGSGNLMKIDNNLELDQAFTLVHGNHEFKAGFDIMRRRQDSHNPTYPVGQFTFSGVYSGYGFADFLLGHPVSSELDMMGNIELRRWLPSFYVQDTYRATPKLTLEYGLRDDLVTPWTERHNQMAGFDPAGAGSLVTVGTAPFTGNSVTDGRYTNFGPRFGFAYSIDNKTVIRGGAGIYYANENITSAYNQGANAPFHGSYIATNASGTAGFAAAAPISAGFPAARPTVFPTAGTTVYYFPRSYKNMTSNEYSLNVQRQLSSHDMLSLAYVGQTATHVLITPNINQPTPGPGAVTARRPYPNFAAINEVCQCANSLFNSLQASYRSHITDTLEVLAAYTYGHSIDDSSGTGDVTAPQNPYDWWQTYRGNSDFDIRHSLVLSWTYNLPVGKGNLVGGGAHGLEEVLIGGWQLNSIDTFQTGTPFTPTMTTSLLNTGGSVQYPNRIGSGKIADPSPNAWFNTSDFVSPGQYTFGNSGRNILYGPGTKEVDASLFKNFGLSHEGSRHLQLRAEVFNVFNTPQFNNPNTAIGSAAAGTITSAGTPSLFARTSREIQLAGKLYW
jgi:hypothetical protein